VLAMGIGISRSAGRHTGTDSGFGVVALASLFPALGVLLLGAYLNASTPQPVPVADFFAATNRNNALKLVPSEEKLAAIAFQRGDETARRACFASDEKYTAALHSLADQSNRRKLLGRLSLQEWLTQRASSHERAVIAALKTSPVQAEKENQSNFGEVVKNESGLAFRAIIPLVLLLVIVLVIILRDRPRRPDEVVLGILFALVGMAILTSGIRLGLAPLGDQVGRPLPQVFRSETHEEGRVILEPFDPDTVLTAFTQNGEASRFFYFSDRRGTPRPVPFEPSRYDAAKGRYEHIVERPPLFGPELTLVGIALVFLFAFGMGYGSTVAEPTLSALGSTVEELTVGMFTRAGVVRTVSLGVGLGLLAGVARILYNFSVIWLLIPAYLTILILTWFSEDDFASIAWDSGGVTTGPITVPLILAMGLGIGGELNVVDGFGIVSMASAFPILTMLIYGIMMQRRQREVLQADREQAHAE